MKEIRVLETESITTKDVVDQIIEYIEHCDYVYEYIENHNYGHLNPTDILEKIKSKITFSDFIRYSDPHLINGKSYLRALFEGVNVVEYFDFDIDEFINGTILI